jgi:hypothetical protein
MTVAATGLRWLIRLLALGQLALGLSFWTATRLDLIPLHMAGGALLVLSLWVLALLAAWARAPLGLVALALAWGALVLWLGLNQSGILTGDWHWIVQVVHLLVGLGAVGQAERLATLVAARPRPTPAL